MRHTRARVPSYPQAEPPGPLTCALYLLVGLFMLSAIIWIFARGLGLI